MATFYYGNTATTTTKNLDPSDPTSAQKFQWLNLARNLDDVEPEDLPADRYSLANLNLDPSGLYLTVSLDITNTLDTQIEENVTVIVNGIKAGSESVTINASSTVNFTGDFNPLFERAGTNNVDVVVTQANKIQGSYDTSDL